MARIKAPELQGRGWLNVGDRALSLSDLRGRFVLLDFWTFCCGNCLHVIDELRPLEAKYVDALTVIGVHSPKFEYEADAHALTAAVEQYVPGPCCCLAPSYCCRKGISTLTIKTCR